MSEHLGYRLNPFFIRACLQRDLPALLVPVGEVLIPSSSGLVSKACEAVTVVQRSAS